MHRDTYPKSSSTHRPHYCVLRQREERAEKFHQQYMGYVVRYERWSKPKGWTRYFAKHPLTALTSIARGRGLPDEWCRQPLNEWGYWEEKAVAYTKVMACSD